MESTRHTDAIMKGISKRSNKEISGSDQMSKKMYEDRLRELENENHRILGIHTNKLTSFEEKIDLISEIYVGLRDTTHADTGMGMETTTGSQRKLQGVNLKNGDPRKKTKQSEIELLREERKLMINEIQSYQETISLQSKTILELTTQQNNLLKSVGEYRVGC